MPRILDFFDGFSSATTPLQQFITAGSLMVFANDAAYEATKGGAGEEGNIYFNSTDKEIRYHDGVEWITLSAEFGFKQESPVSGAINGANVVFEISFVPLSDDSIAVFKDGVMLDRSEFSVSLTDVTLTDAPQAGQSLQFWYVHEGATPGFTPADGIQAVEYYELDLTDELNKFVTLSNTPSQPSKVILDVIGGTSQEFSVDFTVSGDQLSWNGLGLDGFLVSGDKLRIYYFY